MQSSVSLCLIASVLTVSASLDGAAYTVQTRQVFGAKESMDWKADAPIKAVERVSLPIPCLDEANHPLWNVELPKKGAKEMPFEIRPENGTKSGYAFCLQTGELQPAFTTVRMLLPGGAQASGANWARNRATHIALRCKADRAVRLTLHLLQRGKTAGTYQAGFSAEPGEWKWVVLPMDAFGLKTFSPIAGIGFRSVEGEPSALVELSDLQAVRLPYMDAMWSRRTLSISLKGNWHFRTDPGEEGLKGRWFDPVTSEADWQTLQSGDSWENQGIDHFGWGWYRGWVVLPEAAKGKTLKLRLGELASDDEVWFNGVRIGGLSGEYKYKNRIVREYRIPASCVKIDSPNLLAVRVWGGNLTFIGNKSGLARGTFSLELDPYEPLFSAAGKDGEGVPCEAFDLSNAICGESFSVKVRFPKELVVEGGAKTAAYVAEDLQGVCLGQGEVPVCATPGSSGFLANFSGEASEGVYFSGRFRIRFTVFDAEKNPLYASARAFETLNFDARDNRTLAPLPLPERYEETPYGRLRLVDVIDCSTPWEKEDHPFLQGGYDNRAAHFTPGAYYRSKTEKILGKNVRTGGYGWFAYRVGRGKLKTNGHYLLRVEYPEDKPRFCPIEIQIGQNYSDVGWKSGVGAGDVYDDWPLSGRYEWFDTIVAMDGKTVGSGGTGSASSENGFWVYFMNKLRPGMYYAMWDGGPAVASIRLYELDVEKNAPVIRKPEGLPQRTLALDWERQADHDPEDLIGYAKLMGYSAISPIMLKWSFANYAKPLDGYDTVQIDPRDYWAHIDGKEGEKARAPYPERPSQHERYLAATKKMGIDYIPRIEWGGSRLLPDEARAIDSTGKPAKPNRFERWCTNLLHPAAWEDLRRTLDNLLLPYLADNPQLKGVHWRVRCNRVPISYGEADIRRFSEETGTHLPGGRYEQWSAWVTGEGKAAYDDWWHRKRAGFHRTIVEYLRKLRPDLRLYYFNWDADKFGIVEPDLTAWAFVSKVVKPGPEGGRAAYEKEREIRKSLTAEDYIHVLHTGNFGRAFNGINSPDLGLRPELYREISGIELFAPVSYKCYAELPEYFNYFRTSDGVAVSHMVSYDEIGSRVINPKYEGNMMIPGGPDFAMSLELLSWFHADPHTLNFTVYTFGRGFADAHRRFAQAFLALPAIKGQVVPQERQPDLRVRRYEGENGAVYFGIGYKGYGRSQTTVRLPVSTTSTTVSLKDLVSGKTVRCTVKDGVALLPLQLAPMSLSSYQLCL